MTKECRLNILIKDGISIALQITFVFAFLTVFFFVYVQEVEKLEFISQMNLIVDNIMKDIEFADILKKKDDLNIDNEDIVVLTNGIIDLLEEKISIDAKSTINDVLNRNNIVKQKSFNALILFITIIVITLISVILLGFCIPLEQSIKNAMIVVIFVGLTELMFLELIAKKYISTDPNRVKRELSDAIQKWIKKR